MDVIFCGKKVCKVCFLCVSEIDKGFYYMITKQHCVLCVLLSGSDMCFSPLDLQYFASQGFVELVFVSNVLDVLNILLELDLTG